jgi:PAS domain S-box-containing protein
VKRQGPTRQELIEEIRNLREHLLKAKRTIQVIQGGEVDTRNVCKPDEDELYNLGWISRGHRILVESLIVGALILSSDGTICYCNHTLAEMLGLSVQKIISKNLGSYIVPENRAKLMELIMESGRFGAGKGEFLMTRNDGTLLPVNVSLYCTSVADFDGICAIITDLSERKAIEEDTRKLRSELERTVELQTADLARANAELLRESTERKQTEESLLDSERKYQELVDNLNEGIWVIDSDEITTFVNPQMASMLGYAVSEMNGQHLFAFMDSRGIEQCKKNLDRRKKGIKEEHDFELLRRDGTRIIVQMSAAPIIGKNGNYLGAIAGVVDITERKRMEEALRDSGERFRLLYEQTPVPYQSLDEDGFILEVNSAWLETLGYTRNDVIGKWFGSLLAPSCQPAMEASFAYLKLTGTIHGAEFEMVKRNGDHILVTIEGRVSYNPDHSFKQTHCTFQDITEHRQMEEELRLSDSRFRSFFNLSLDGIFSFNSEGRFLRANPAAERISGYTEDELCNLNFLDLCAPDYREATFAAFARGISTGQSNEIETALISKDGRIVDVLIAGSPILVSGRVDGVFCIVRDVTEQKRAERALRESEERFEAFMNNSPVTAWIKDEYGHYVYLNTPAEADFRLPLEDCLGKSDLDIFPAERARKHREDDLSVLQDERPINVVDEHTYADGSRKIWWKFKFPLKDAAGNRFVGGIGLDISEHKQAESALRESEGLLRLFIEHAPASIAMFDRDMRYLIASRRWLSDYNLGEHDLRGVSHYAVFPEITAEWKAVHQRALSGEVVLADSDKFLRADGSMQWLRWEVRPWRDASGNVAGIIIFTEDITARKQVEENLRMSRDELELRVRERTADLEKANQELRQIPSKLIAVQEEERKRLASELHDSIGQTLAAVKFWVEMALKFRDEGNDTAALDHLERFVPTLQRSIEETRNIYMGLRPSILEDMGLLATLEWLRWECMKLYPQRHIELATGVAEDEIPESLKICIFRIAQEALNNVAKHSKAEWVDISLSRNCDGIELIVSDDGVGMDLGQILHSSTARSLGLSSMRERAELTEGSFTIESTPGQGTTIRVCWPITVGGSTSPPA